MYRSYQPVTNKLTITLLILLTLGFGLVSEIRLADGAAVKLSHPEVSQINPMSLAQ